jgi:hypothetical protein
MGTFRMTDSPVARRHAERIYRVLPVDVLSAIYGLALAFVGGLLTPGGGGPPGSLGLTIP